MAFGSHPLMCLVRRWLQQFPVLWCVLQRCSFSGRALAPWQAVSGGEKNPSSVGSNYYVILYLCQYLFQPNFDNTEQNLVITIDYTTTTNFCVIRCSHCSEAVFAGCDSRRGAVFSVQTWKEGAQPGGCAGSRGGLCLHRRCSRSLPLPLCVGGVRQVWVRREVVITGEGTCVRCPGGPNRCW